MSGIDRALAKNPFEVDPTQCYLAAASLKAFSPGNERYPWSHASKPTQIAFKLFFVSICHQINWDFLQRRMFEALFAEDHESMILMASAAKPATISSMLTGYHRPERIRPAERAKYLRETAKSILLDFHRDPTELVSTHRVFGEGGLLELLKKIPAFAEDPLSKKANAFAQELARERIVDFEDADLIPPAIDYHLIRLYLRTGRVFSKDKHISSSLRTGTTHRMRLTKLLREGVSEALSLTASYAGMPVHELNYLEWQIARSRCEKDSTNCDGDWPADLLDGSVTVLSSGCPLRGSCTAYAMPEWRTMVEPELKKAFY